MWLNVEITSRCNAWCPSCPRNNRGYGLTDFTPQDLDPSILKDTIQRYNIFQVQMSGVLGDPCAAINLHEHLELCMGVKRLQIHTNGSLRKPDWWANLAHQFAHLDQFDVWFGIDGLEDTHSYYRQGTDWNRIIENARNFILAGGSAVWQFIPFKHNQHQIMDCIRMSQELGFTRFEFVKNARYTPVAYHYQTGEPLDIVPWKEDEKFNRVHSRKDFVDRKKCMHLEYPSLYLSAKGLVTPCCFLNTTPLSEVDIDTEFSNNNYRKTCLEWCG